MTDGVRPEDVLPDGIERTTFGDVEVRKGSVAAFVANARQLDGLEGAEREPVLALLRELAPAIRAIGLLDVFQPRSPEVALLLQPGGAAHDGG